MNDKIKFLLVGGIIFVGGSLLGGVTQSEIQESKIKNLTAEFQARIDRAEGQADLVAKMYTSGCRDDLRIVFGEHVNSLHKDIYAPKIIKEEN